MDIEFGKGLKHNSEKWFITGHEHQKKKFK